MVTLWVTSLGRFCIDRKWKNLKCFVALGWLSRRRPVITFTTVEEAFNFTGPPFFPLGLISYFVHLSALSFFISATRANESIVYDDSESKLEVVCAYLKVDWRYTFGASLCQLYRCRREEILSQNKLTTWREAVFKGQILFALFSFPHVFIYYLLPLIFAVIGPSNRCLFPE